MRQAAGRQWERSVRRKRDVNGVEKERDDKKGGGGGGGGIS